MMDRPEESLYRLERQVSNLSERPIVVAASFQLAEEADWKSAATEEADWKSAATEEADWKSAATAGAEASGLFRGGQQSVERVICPVGPASW
jgi:hypothetical protein